MGNYPAASGTKNEGRQTAVPHFRSGAEFDFAPVWIRALRWQGAANPAGVLSRRLQRLRSAWRAMNLFLGCLVGAEKLQHVVDRVFKPRAGFVGGLYAHGGEAANFKSIYTLRKSAVYLFGTHGGLRLTQVLVRGGTELVGSGRTAKAEQVWSIPGCVTTANRSGRFPIARPLNDWMIEERPPRRISAIAILRRFRLCQLYSGNQLRAQNETRRIRPVRGFTAFSQSL